MTAIQDVAQDIATNVATVIKTAKSLGIDMTTEQAIDHVAATYRQYATDARTRHGQWRFETATEAIEEALFAASIARDVQENTFRPSTGPVGDYVRGLLTRLAPGTSGHGADHQEHHHNRHQEPK